MKTKPLFVLLLASCILLQFASKAQSILFDFNSAPVYTPLPISQTVLGLTANFSATGPGYSIQSVSSATVVPIGYTGNFIFPSSINLSDLHIGFNQPISDFSIWYSCQELGCDDAATMRVTAYLNGSYVGTNTMVAVVPGTWPVDTLSCSFTQGFDSVVIHYDSPPPLCQDYGVIFIVDNMRVTPLSTGALSMAGNNIIEIKITTTIIDQLTIEVPNNNKKTTVYIYDILGKQILQSEFKNSTTINTENLNSGTYLYKLSDSKMVLKKGEFSKQ